MSRLFLSCLAVFITALYVTFDADFSTGARFIAAAVVFVLSCAGFGALCGELFSRGWDAVNDAQASHSKPVPPPSEASKAKRYLAKHMRKPPAPPYGDRL